MAVLAPETVKAMTEQATPDLGTVKREYSFGFFLCIFFGYTHIYKYILPGVDVDLILYSSFLLLKSNEE